MYKVYVWVTGDLDVVSERELVEALGPSTRRESRFAPAPRFSSWQHLIGESLKVWSDDIIDPESVHLQELAGKIAALVAVGKVSASLVIVQEIDDLDDCDQTGIWLQPEVVQWMARAHLSLDIDQYIYGDSAG